MESNAPSHLGDKKTPKTHRLVERDAEKLAYSWGKEQGETGGEIKSGMHPYVHTPGRVSSLERRERQ